MLELEDNALWHLMSPLRGGDAWTTGGGSSSLSVRHVMKYTATWRRGLRIVLSLPCKLVGEGVQWCHERRSLRS